MRLIIALLLCLTPLTAYAQSTAEPVLPGLLTTSGCPGGQLSCFVPYSVSNPLPVTGSGGSSTTNRCTNLTAQQCAALYGYAIPTEWGATCNGTTDDAVALEHAAAASGFPVMIAGTAPNGTILNCNIRTQIKATVDNEAFFAFPNSPVYDSSSQIGYKPTLSVNNSDGLFTNACAIDMNGHPLTLEGFNIKGDFVGTGTTAVCNSVAYSGGTLPWLALRHISIANFDDGVGYAINTTTGLPTGTLGDNLIEGIYEDVTFEENGWATYNNYSDLKFTDGRITGNDCGGIVLSGTGQGNHLSQMRFENNGAHQFCGTIAGTVGASLTVTGIDNLCSNCGFENDSGAGIELTSSWGNFKMDGYFKGEGSRGTASYDADVVFTGGAGATGHAIFSANHIKVSTKPAYNYEFNGTHDNHIYIVGDNGDSSGHATAFFNFAGSTPTDLSALQSNGTSSQLTIAGNIGNPLTVTSSEIATGIKLYNSSGGAKNWIIENEGSNIVNYLCYNEATDFIYSLCMHASGYLIVPSSGIFGWSNATDDARQALQTGINSPAAGIVAVTAGTTGTGAIEPDSVISVGTKFTTSGCSVSATTGGASAGTYTSGTTGTCTVVITMKGATGRTAPTGWACSASDRTTPADLITQTASSTTTATLAGTTISGDVVSFSCMGY